MIVLSRELQQRQNNLPVSKHQHVTDIGHFPHTENHFVSRESGIKEHIVIFCVSGKGKVRLRGKKREMTAGQLLLIPPGVPHQYQADRTFPWNIYWFHYSGDLAAEYAQLLGLDEQQPVMQISNPDELIQQFESMFNAYKHAFSDSALINASTELIKILALANSIRTGKHRKSQLSEQRILKSIEYIIHEYNKVHTLEELSHQAGLSVPHYMTLFRQQTGTSPLRYLARVRLRHACDMLDRTTMNIAEVAEAVGYEDPFYFSRLFSKNIGHSPSDYRKLNPHKTAFQ